MQTTTWLAWPDRWRVDAAIGEELVASTAFDGTVLRQAIGGKAAVPLEGLAAELTAEDSSFRLFGDWRALGIPIQVVQRPPPRRRGGGARAARHGGGSLDHPVRGLGHGPW
jgi:hypothetical protein